MSKKQRNKQRGEIANSVGELGQLIAEKILPSAMVARPGQRGFDMVTLDGTLIEIKCSRFLKEKQRWEWQPSIPQFLMSDYFLFIALNEFGKLYKAWLYPVDKMETNHPIISDVNLDDYKQYEVEV